MTDIPTLFQKLHKEDAAKLEMVMNEGWFQRACTFAVAKMAHEGASVEQISGATKFKNELLELTAERAAPGGLPDKSALKTYQ